MRMQFTLLLYIALCWSFALVAKSRVDNKDTISHIDNGGFSIQRCSDSLYILHLGESQWKLPFPVYRFCTGDVDGNGSIDAIVGVIKSTRYDKELRRRVFIFKNYHGMIRPLWLGSQLGQPVIDFTFLQDKKWLKVIERGCDGIPFTAYYRWRGFGMEYVSEKHTP